MDLLHRFGKSTYTLAASLGASYIRGDTAAIQAAQLFSNRYFQRPDAHSFHYDPSRTSLAGLTGDLYVNKVAGNWLWGLAGSTTTPGFEVNDIGFQRRVDRISGAAYAGYHWTKPGRVFRESSAFLSMGPSWNYDLDNIQKAFTAFAFGTFRNFWGYNASVAYSARALDDRLTRGGPLAATPAAWNAFTEVFSDLRRPVSFDASVSYSWNDADGWTLDLTPPPHLHLQRLRAGQRLDHRLRWGGQRLHGGPGRRRARRPLLIRQPRLPHPLAPQQRGAAVGVPTRLHAVRRMDPEPPWRLRRSQLRPHTRPRPRAAPRPADECAPRKAQLLVESLTARPSDCPSYIPRMAFWTLRRSLGAAAVLAVSLALGWAAVVLAVAVTATRDQATTSDAIVVLGAAQYNGRPSPVFRPRLDHAAALYQRGLAPVVLVTGGVGTGDSVAESEVGRRYLVRAGLPDAVIVALPAGSTPP